MKFGNGREDELVRAAIQRRKPIPQEIADKPALSESNELAWRCYWDLRRGQDPCEGLRWLDVLQWANAYSFTFHQMQGLQESIVVLDSVFVAYHRKVVEERRKKAEASAKRK